MISIRLARMVEFDLLHPKVLFVNHIGKPNGLSMGLAGQGSTKPPNHIYISDSDDMWRNVLFSVNAGGKENLEHRITYMYEVRSILKRKRKEKESSFFFDLYESLQKQSVRIEADGVKEIEIYSVLCIRSIIISFMSVRRAE